MRLMIAACMITVAGVTAASAQGPAGKPEQPVEAAQATPAPAQPSAKPVPAHALRGCVSTDPDQAGSFTLTEEGKEGGRFRITGRSMREFAGRLVEVSVFETKGLTIKGGLKPSPNVAAQAGHLDSARAAIASQPGANAGKPDVPTTDIRVNRVRSLEGSCKP